MQYKAEIKVTLKESILDPQGSAVRKALHSMSYSNILDVRIGKHIELMLSADDAESAEREAQEIADKLLANPVIENFSLEVQAVGGAER
ncbi:MAG: phosphoribosylformylglycinamidine synthase subunit PurS [Bacillota bacterium]